MTVNQKTEFLYNVIGDIQQTIKALDVKLGFLFVVYFIPVIGYESAFDVAAWLKNSCGCFFALSVATAGVWLFGFINLILAVSPISCPVNEPLTHSITGRFYNGDLFTFGIFGSLFNSKAQSIVGYKQFVRDIPSTDKSVEQELEFEVFKLVYIRDLKARRTKNCFFSIFISIVLGISLWTVYLIN